jgi:large subunit ribosomal protein L15
MQQHQLRLPKGAKKSRKRVGRGDSSGHGSLSGRGRKGQKSRSGGSLRISFQGGQNPLVKAMPMMRGFTNIFRKEYNVVNIDQLITLSSNSEITPELLKRKGVIRNSKKQLKILGKGEIETPLVVQAHKFSKSAKTKIEAAGGTANVII